MTCETSNRYIRLCLDSIETAKFADGSYGTGHWPCSVIRGRRLFVEFDRKTGDLVDLELDGGKGEQDCPSNELLACIGAVASGQSLNTQEILVCVLN